MVLLGDRSPFTKDQDLTVFKNVFPNINISEDVETEMKEDKSILGGFVAKYKGMIYDGSVKGQLMRLKNNLR